MCCKTKYCYNYRRLKREEDDVEKEFNQKVKVTKLDFDVNMQGKGYEEDEQQLNDSLDGDQEMFDKDQEKIDDANKGLDMILEDWGQEIGVARKYG